MIAETKDLATKYAKIVVTDAQGRYVIPEVPDANYKVWVRGEGLMDTAQVDARPGKQLDFKAEQAIPAQAAQLYPGMYWYAMLEIPAKSEIPGTGDKSNQTPDTTKMQEQWVDTVKKACRCGRTRWPIDQQFRRFELACNEHAELLFLRQKATNSATPITISTMPQSSRTEIGCLKE